jgi:hypothetical protein
MGCLKKWLAKAMLMLTLKPVRKPARRVSD